MTELEQKLWEAVDWLRDNNIPKDDGILGEIIKPIAASMPHWLEKVIKDEDQGYGELHYGDLTSVWNQLSLETKLACIVVSLREKRRNSYSRDPEKNYD